MHTPGNMPQRLIVITGMNVAAKARLAEALIALITAHGISVTAVDNNDAPLNIDGYADVAAAVPLVRLSAGCVCCSLAGALIPTVARIQSQVVVLVVSALAQADATAQVISNLGMDYRIVAVIDERTRMKFPHVAARLEAAAQLVTTPDADAESVLNQLA